MASFALVTEGITDQEVIAAILYGFYEEEPDIREAQPVRDETDEHRQGGFAGWEKVFEYCGLPHFEQIFLTNDYAVIQVDTDVAEHPNFGVPLTAGGKDRAEADIIAAVKDVLVARIGAAVYAKYAARILFAIAVHSIECWLIPAYENTPGKRKRVKQCANHLAPALAKHNIDFKKDSRTYEKVAKLLLKRKNLDMYIEHNVSFKAFVTSLPPEQPLE
jgi:hypothetical protein